MDDDATLLARFEALQLAPAAFRARMHETPCATSGELLAQHPDLLDQSALGRHYDVPAILASPLARRVLVLPERP